MASPVRRLDRSLDLETLVRLYPPAPEFFETIWLADPDRLAQLQLGRLRQELARASRIPFYERLWADTDVDPDRVQSLDDFSALPYYTIDHIRASLERCPPWGDYQGVAATDAGREPLRVFFSGGTTGEPRPTLFTQWDRQVGALIAARSFAMAGLRPGDIVLNAWAFGTHQSAAQVDEALYGWLGALPVVTSSGQVTPTIKQLELASRYGAASILTMGDYLLHMADVAVDLGLDPKRDFQFRCFPGPSVGHSDELEAVWGVPAYDAYGFHEVGWVAAECPYRGGLHIYEDAFIVEVVDVDTGSPVADGDMGNLVVTCLFKTGSAQIRYNTQDLSRLLPRERCACGSWMRKMDYFSGRSDNMVKLRGTNVWPEAVGRIATADSRVSPEYFVVAENHGALDSMTVSVESSASPTDAPTIASDLSAVLRAKLGVRVNVEVVGLGALRDLTGLGSRSKPLRFEDRRPRNTNAGSDLDRAREAGADA